jgi:hypothetical protein
VALDTQGGEEAQAAQLADHAPAPRPRHARVARLFLRLLGVVYLIAFLSLAVQVEGLVGSKGILPVSELLAWVRSQAGAERYWLLPTLSWLDPSDAFLLFLCYGGAGLALLLSLGLAPALLLLALFVFYLSLVCDGQVFLGYQWDSLLLEASFLAIFLAPLSLRLRRGFEPPPVALWLLRFLLFRLMFSSGVVKLRSGDPAWRGLGALRYHYETQPIPTWTAWWAHQLPSWFQTLSCALMFGIELVAPLLIFAPRRLRLAAFFPLAGLQLLIAGTGNFAFFNLLASVLCVLLLDDAALPWREAGRAQAGRRWPRALLLPVAALTGPLSALQLLLALGAVPPLPSPLIALYRAAQPFRIVNSYGLFAIMTSERPEILVEGSNDGVVWKPYQFRFKPGDPLRAPSFVAPHQPRLDWQMWFAALGQCEENPWFARFLGRLGEGAPQVLGLLAANPFPERPPAHLRATLFNYHFTDRAARRATGAWWRRDANGPYCRDLGLD